MSYRNSCLESSSEIVLLPVSMLAVTRRLYTRVKNEERLCTKVSWRLAKLAVVLEAVWTLLEKNSSGAQGLCSQSSRSISNAVFRCLSESQHQVPLWCHAKLGKPKLSDCNEPCRRLSSLRVSVSWWEQSDVLRSHHNMSKLTCISFLLQLINIICKRTPGASKQIAVKCIRNVIFLLQFIACTLG